MKQHLLLFLLSVSFCCHCYSQGKINKAEQSLKTNTKTPTTYSKPTYNDKTDGSEDNFFTEIIGDLFIKFFAYTAYAVAFESPFEVERKGHNAHLTKHPYKNNHMGNYTYEWDKNTEIFTSTLSYRFVFETNKINGNHFNADMKFLKRWGLEIDYLQLWEENTNFGNNSLAIYTALVKYNRVRTERFTAWWGLGTAYVHGEVNELGFTYGLGAELFLINPISLESNFNKTAINSNSVGEFNALLNYHINHYKFSLGYEHLKIGSVGFSNFSIGTGISF